MTEPTLQERLRATTLEMASACSVPMELWNRHSNAALQAADALDATARITGLEAMLADAQAEVERLREALGVILGTTGTSAIHDRAAAALGRTP